MASASEKCASPGCWLQASRCPVHDNRPAMTATDETPAQPITEVCCVCGSTDVGYHNYRDQPFCWPCADGKSCWTNAAQPDAVPASTCGAREPVRGAAVACNRPAGHQRDVHRWRHGLNALEWACDDEDVAPAPDGNTGRADVYEAPVRAMLAPYSDGIGTLSYDRMYAVYVAHDDYRRLIDAARAPLLAEVDQMHARFARLQILCLGIDFRTPARADEVMRIIREGIGRD